MTAQTSKGLSPDAYRERDLAILRFVGCYGVGLIEAISRVFGGGKPLGHVVRRLADSGLLQLHSRALEGGVSYCRLTEKGAELIKLPKGRASQAIGTQALDKAIAVSVWCCLSDSRRYRLERGEFLEIFPDGAKVTNQVHCLGQKEDEPVAYHLRLVQGNHETALKQLALDIGATAPSIQRAIELGRYHFTLLVDSERKAQHLMSALERITEIPLNAAHVQLSATARTVAAYLRAQKMRAE